MEHIVQFGIGIDDEAIRKIIMEKAEKSILNDLKKDIRSEIIREIFVCDSDWYGRERKINLQDWVKDLVEKTLKDNKDQIIKMASEKLADKMSRTKAVKEAMAEKVREEGEGGLWILTVLVTLIQSGLADITKIHFSIIGIENGRIGSLNITEKKPIFLRH